MSDIYAVVDLETSIKNAGEGSVGNHKGTSFYANNKICYTGVLKGGVTGITNHLDPVTAADMTKLDPNITNSKLLVGANFKFDMLYLMRDYPEFKAWMRAGKIWDIQLAEYILTGQQEKWASLDKMAVKYGGVVKDDKVKELWNAGVDTEDIDADIIIPYLQGDLDNTKIVFESQVMLARDLDMMALITSQMEALMATTEMEFNGMQFDKINCLKDAEILQGSLASIKDLLHTDMGKMLTIPEEDLNCGSTTQISAILFGGSVKYKARVDCLEYDNTPIVYKSGKKIGQIKTKIVEKVCYTRGLGLHTEKEWETKREGVYQVNDGVLSALLAKQHIPSVTQFIDNLVQYRSLAKDIVTYYVGYSDLVWPDNKIHPNFNHCATATGRLSHSNPNLGNTSHSKEE